MTYKTTLLSFTSAAILAFASSAAMADALVGVNAKVEADSNPNVTATSTEIIQTSAPTAIVKGDKELTYDVNGDGKVSMEEVADRLFYQLDVDGNEVLDNIEWDKPHVIAGIPFETVTVTKVDVDGDGVVEAEAVNVDVFMEQTGLEKFDNDGNGLSAHEFTGKSVLEMDTDGSGVIEKKEWESAYLKAHTHLNANNAIYNDGQ